MYLQYFSSLERAEDVLKKVSGVRARPVSVYAQLTAKAGRDARRVTSTGLCFGRSEGLLHLLPRLFNGPVRDMELI